MKEKQKFSKCNCCGNIIDHINGRGASMVCCDEDMVELIPNTAEASNEKYPEAADLPHPMEDEHYIRFIHVETENGSQRKYLKPGDNPNAKFSFVNDKPVAVYVHCQMHGLWKKEVNSGG